MLPGMVTVMMAGIVTAACARSLLFSFSELLYTPAGAKMPVAEKVVLTTWLWPAATKPLAGTTAVIKLGALMFTE